MYLYLLHPELEQWKQQGFRIEQDKEIKSKRKLTKTQKKPTVIKRIVGSSFDKGYPSIARWVRDYGWIEIGQDHYSSSLIRVLDEGGMIWESSEDYETIDEAIQATEEALADWIRENMR